MSVFEVKTDARTWLRNRRKDELIYIILANLDRINLFADASDVGKDGMPLRAELERERDEALAKLKDTTEALHVTALHIKECEADRAEARRSAFRECAEIAQRLADSITDRMKRQGFSFASRGERVAAERITAEIRKAGGIE
jgi:hypothetical protein